ncbi:tripartite tricarboxylate transporter substrate binding protein [Rhodobacteraceae bacterium D3-12]|nr:tripartite tricarboxylate transporter substrate binding protein [Rhodobacteraceae bacterium D3-12]
MNMTIFRAASLFAYAVIVVVGSLGPAKSVAEGFPDRPITIRVAYPPGGPADESIRTAAKVLEQALNAKLVITNAPGANGSIAAAGVLNADPNGFTLLGTTGTDFISAPRVVPSADYNPTAFHLLGQVGVADFMLVSSSARKFASLDELLDYARNPNNKPLLIAHWGDGSAPQIVGKAFQSKAGIELLEVPYKGAAPAIASVIGGHVDLSFVPLSSATLGLMKSNKMHPIALAAPNRSDVVPDVPTFSESDEFDNFSFSIWSALFAPPGTPEPVVQKLTDAMNAWTTSQANIDRVRLNAGRLLPARTVADNAKLLAAEAKALSEIFD